jgi:acyl-CoA synthetase (AMP-forming)/AMP-acid ligase II
VIDGEGRPVAPGEVGEIAIRAPNVMKGYWNRQEATRSTVIDGWLRTGDAGYFDEDGYLYIHDRVKDMIVSGGENIYPAEVENALFGHPAVADVAVIGVPDERWGEAVKAIVVKKPGASADPSELISYARARIAGYKLPKSVDFADALPRNPSGKILRRELRKPYWEGRERQVN